MALAILLLFSFIVIELAFGAADPIYGCRTLNSDQNMVLEITVDSIVNISFSGPSGVWYSYGLGNNVMAGTNIIVVNGDGSVEDRELTGYNKGTQLTDKTSVDATSESDGVRSMQMQRAINEGSNFYTYPEEAGAVELIFAWGSVEQIDDATSMAGYGHNMKINFVANKDDVDCDSDGDSKGYIISYNYSIICIIATLFYVLYY